MFYFADNLVIFALYIAKRHGKCKFCHIRKIVHCTYFSDDCYDDISINLLITLHYEKDCTYFPDRAHGFACRTR